MRQLDFGLRQRIGIDREVMIVRRDLDLAGVQLLHRMIAAVMPELQLESFAAQRNPRKLMAQTDAEDRLPSHQPADVIHRIGAWLGIAGAVRQKDAVRLQRQHVFRQASAPEPPSPCILHRATYAECFA